MSIRYISILLVTGCFCAGDAQYFSLATPDDGSVVYFSTRHRRTGTDEPFRGRIYVVDSLGLRSFAQREKEPPEDLLPFGPNPTNFFDLSDVDVSADGSIVSFTGRRECTRRDCIGELFESTTVVGPGIAVDEIEGGDMKLSANGRFGLVHSRGGLGSSEKVVDLQTGDDSAVEAPDFPSPGRVIANDGSYFSSLFQLRISAFDGSTKFSDASIWAESASMDAEGSLVLFVSESRVMPRRYLRTLSLQGATIRDLVETPGEILDPVLSSDGESAFFVSTLRLDEANATGPRQAFVVNTASGDLRQLTFGLTAIQRGTLSGDGRTAYVVTGRGQLVKIDVATGDAAELLPRSLHISALVRSDSDSVRLVAARGSYTELQGAGLVDQGVTAESLPLPRGLGGVILRVDELKVPLFAVAPDIIAFQMPWEFRPDRHELLSLPIRVEATGVVSPFEAAPTTVVLPQGERPKAFELPAKYGISESVDQSRALHFPVQFALAA